MFKIHNKVSHVFLLPSPLTLAFLLLTLNQQLFAGKKIELLQSWTKYCIQIQGINKNGPSIECFTADFSQFCGATVKICSFGGRLSICHQFQAFQRFNVHQALKGKSLDNSWQQVYSLFDENNLVPFHLRWKEIVLKCDRVRKYSVQDCSCFLLKFRSSPGYSHIACFCTVVIMNCCKRSIPQRYQYRIFDQCIFVFL